MTKATFFAYYFMHFSSANTNQVRSQRCSLRNYGNATKSKPMKPSKGVLKLP